MPNPPLKTTSVLRIYNGASNVLASAINITDMIVMCLAQYTVVFFLFPT